MEEQLSDVVPLWILLEAAELFRLNLVNIQMGRVNHSLAEPAEGGFEGLVLVFIDRILSFAGGREYAAWGNVLISEWMKIVLRSIKITQ